MWLLRTSLDGFDRPRLTFAAFSVLATAGAGYAAYRTLRRHHRTLLPPSSSPLHRSNAIRRHSRHPRRYTPAPSTSSSDSDQDAGPGDENENGIETENELAGGIFGMSDAGPDAPADNETVFDAHWWDDNPPTHTSVRAGHNIVTLLFRVSEDNARRNACIHRGCRCNACGTVPIRGLRYHCANCADYDLCEACEQQGLHYKTHVFYKIRIPNKTAGTRLMQPVWYTGDPDSTRRTLPKGLIARLSREVGLERPELEAHWEQWTFMANTEWRDDPDGLGLAMDRKTFERCLVSSKQATGGPNLIHDRMFSFYDTNHDGLIGFSEYLHGVCFPSRTDKIRRIFDIYDVDGDQYVSRRDFLRLFRANYVLYKDIFRDVLDSMNDQRMGSTETRQLVNSRQPLSSHFGRDERLPGSDGEPLQEGKVISSNGHVELQRHIHGVVRPDMPDTAPRQELLMKLAETPDSPPFGPFEPDPYVEAMLDPPTALNQLPDLLVGNHASADAGGAEEEEQEQEQEHSDPESAPANEMHNNNTMAAATNNSGGIDYDDPVLLPGDIGPPSVLREHRHLERRLRTKARKELLQRWVRRQFYLDEEEGALAPEGWDPEADILAGVRVNGGESSKAAPSHEPPSARSRSSSRVRFAEGPDDFDTRSNVSNSSSRRSVPERWGGMDIPVAERDAGKEILYQVTQQAFNEILDTLFKPAEDLAVQAAETKQERLTHQAALEQIDLDRELALQRYGEHLGEDDDDEEEEEEEEGEEGEEYTTEEDERGGDDDAGHKMDDDSIAQAVDEGPGEVLDQPEKDNENKENLQVDDATAQQQHRQHQQSVASLSFTTETPHFDPTMPQFRPNDARPATSGTDATISDHGSMAAPPGAFPAKTPTTKISRDRLVQLKRLDVAEAEAIRRGGWGRLDYQEFETAWKSQESRGHKLDYIGAWVEFCIL